MLQAIRSHSVCSYFPPNLAGSECKAMHLLALQNHDKGKMPFVQTQSSFLWA